MHGNHLHWYQSMIVSLCAPHHIVGVSFSANLVLIVSSSLILHLRIVSRKFPNHLACENWVVL
jgi:hypothetical protein